MTTFLVVDDVLTPDEIEQTKNFFVELRNGKSMWLDKGTSTDFPLEKIVNIVAKTFDLSLAVGYECWSHVNTKTTWHIDKDEASWEDSKTLKHPICSIVYYPYIKNMSGGRFVTKSHLVVPRQNRLVAFSPGLLHAVENFKGERMSCAINPWAHKLGV